MALATAPATTARRGQAPIVHRSFTAPPRSGISTQSAADAETKGAETLFAHPFGKIISFTASERSVRRHSSIGDTTSEFEDAPAGTLPWASMTERTIAAGPLQIYRVLGSVAFLNSGKTLQPLLAKSQCWCVDGVSKFVLRIRPRTYYRIELPSESAKDEERVEDMKKILKTILQYEVTPCPFKRGFTVDLPEPPSTPVRLIPWKPKSQPMFPFKEVVEENLETSKHVERSITPSKRTEEAWIISEPAEEPKQLKKPVVWETWSDGTAENKSPSVAEIKADIEASEAEIQQQAEEDQKRLSEAFRLRTPTRPRQLRTARTVTAPPQLSLHTTPPSNATRELSSSPKADVERPRDPVPSTQATYPSFHSPISPLQESPSLEGSSPEVFPNIIKNAKVRNEDLGKCKASETEKRESLWDLTEATGDEDTDYLSPPDFPPVTKSTSRAAAESSDILTSDNEAMETRLRLRQSRIQRQRMISPMPSSSNLYTPVSPPPHVSGHHLSTAIIQRTCSLLLGPPAHLIALMMRIAAKITKGVFQGTAFGVTNEGQHIPCSWDFSDGSGDDENSLVDDSEGQDDFGFSLGKTASGRDVQNAGNGGSWEVD